MIYKSEKLLEKLKSIGKEKADRLHVLADFDRTLTKAFTNGKKIQSLISILRDEEYLTPDYPKKAHALFNYYHPIEINPLIPFEEKNKAMEEWWKKHFDLLIASKLNVRDIKKAISSENLQLRDGAVELLKCLAEAKIPLVILSANGLGKDSIELFLKEKNLLTDNIIIISNGFTWDKEGFAIQIEYPIVHSLNKNEALIQKLPEHSLVDGRPNIILLGDNLEDAAMAKEKPGATILRVGFLNEKVEENLENYKEKFDLVITDDGSMEEVNNIIKGIY